MKKINFSKLMSGIKKFFKKDSSAVQAPTSAESRRRNSAKQDCGNT